MEQSEQKPAEQKPVEKKPKTSSNTVLIIIVVVVVLGIAALAGGYFVMRSIKARVSQKIGQKIGENVLEKAIEKGTGQKVDVNSDGDSVNVETESGSWSASGTGNIKLPADFPSDVFVYSDAKITFASSTQANPAEGTNASYMVGYVVNESLNEVLAKYRAEMAKNGWTKETEANYGAMMITFKKDARQVMVTLSESQDGQMGATNVSVTGSDD